MTSARITVDVTFDPDAITVNIADDGGLDVLELAAVLDIAKHAALYPETESVPT